MTDWTEERCAQRPETVAVTSASKLIQRRNIRAVHHDEMDGQPAYDEFVCECRTMTAAEYARLCGEQNEATQAYIDMMLEDL